MTISFKQNYLIYFFISIFSMFSSIYLKDLINTSDLALGKHTIIFFIPFILYAFYFLFIEDLNFKIVKFVIFCFISFVPAYEILFNQIFHIIGDDSWSYSRLAQFISSNLSFQGNPEGISYYRQPGFTYFYAFELLVFQYESRLLQLFNLIIFFLVFFFLLDMTSKKLNKNLFVIKIIIFLSIPYAVKNILYTYSEWFFILIFFLSIIFYKKKYFFLFVIFFALTVFVRQNFFFSFFLIFGCFIINSQFSIRKKFIYSIVSLLIFLLPLMHNYYFANNLKIISNNGMDQYQSNYSTKTINIESDPNLKFLNLNNKFFEYFNFDWISQNFTKIVKHIYKEHISFILLIGYNQDLSNIIISLFVFPSIIFLLYIFFNDSNYLNISINLTLIMLTYGISFIAGGGSFPRFEFSIFYYLLFSKIIIKELDFNIFKKSNNNII